jgi:hypothetical protein
MVWSSASMLCIASIRAFRLVLAMAAVVVLAFVPARCRAAGEAAGVGDVGRELGAARGAGVVEGQSAQAVENSTNGAGGTHDPQKQGWEERLQRHEKHSRVAVVIFLGVVFLILVLWWGWGKLYHRPRKL